MKKFDRINLEITTDCNLSCSFCPHAALHGSDQVILSPSQFEKIAMQAKPLCEQLTLHLLGEPLCHPQLEQLLIVANSLEVPIEITTNGLLLSKWQQQLADAKTLRQINFSLQSFIDNYPDRSIEDYLAMLCAFADQLYRLRPEIYINYRWWKVDGDVVDPLLESLIVFLERHYQTTIRRGINVSTIKSKKIADHIYLHFDSRFDWPSLQAPFISAQGTCRALQTHIGIHADGTVVPCCLDYQKVMVLGNCLETPLTKILETDRARQMLEGFGKGKLVEELCRHCSYIARFKSKKDR